VPFFKTGPDDNPSTEQIAANAADLLSDSLNFTGYFKLLHRDSFLIEAETFDIIAPNIIFQNWRAIGAELLITGGFTVRGDLVEMELRLFDTFKGKMLVGKLYKGLLEDVRQMIHRFCGEVIFYLTGNRGIFGSEIAFVSTGTGNSEIFTCGFDGHHPTQFTHTGDITLSPAWSSDGQWIAYTAFPRGKPGLLIKHRNEKRGAVFSGKGVKIDPSWVPGKFQLAATLSYQGDPEIYLLTGTGKVIKRLTYNRGIDVSPSWSPDGQKMAYVSKQSGTPQIYIWDAASGRSTRLTFEGRYNQQPSWSPKGDKIAYTGMVKGAIDIFVVGVDGTGLMQLTYQSGDNESPSWSPDGSMIVFSSTREGPSRIYVMTAYGTDQRRLLALPGDQKNPEWSPRIVDY
jgi:TolB protein